MGRMIIFLERRGLRRSKSRCVLPHANMVPGIAPPRCGRSKCGTAQAAAQGGSYSVAHTIAHTMVAFWHEIPFLVKIGEIGLAGWVHDCTVWEILPVQAHPGGWWEPCRLRCGCSEWRTPPCRLGGGWDRIPLPFFAVGRGQVSGRRCGRRTVRRGERSWRPCGRLP